MALTKTYYTDSNVAFADTSTTVLLYKSWLFMLKSLLIGNQTGTNGTSGAAPGGALWTVESSCDSSTANLVGTDLWTSTYNAAKIVRAAAGTAHSWIVLKSPVALGPYYMCIDYASAADTTFTLTFSKAAFSTGGTTLNRPTSTGEWGNTALVLGDATTGTTYRACCTRDANGGFYLYTARNAAGFFNSFFCMAPMTETRTGEAHNILAGTFMTIGTRGVLQGTAAAVTNWVTATGGFSSRSPSNNFSPDSNASSGLMVPPTSNTAYWNSVVSNQADSLTDAFPAYYYFSGNSVGVTAVRGKLPDVFAINSQRSVGNTEPSTGDPEQVVIGNFLIPCGGVTPLI